MKYIDPKSLTIGVLAASLVFACTDSNNKTTNSPSLVSEAKAATGVGDKWDDKQEWDVWVSSKAEVEHARTPVGRITQEGKPGTGGWEPIAVFPGANGTLYRKRIT